MTSTGHESPLLEFDPSRTALIDPAAVFEPRDMPAACLLTWFRDAAERMVERLGGRVIAPNRWEDGDHPTYEVAFEGVRLAIAPMPVGAPAAAGLLEELIAFGCRAFVAAGGAGVLAPEMTLGHLVVVTSALRDEGTSHHYLPPSRTVDADRAGVAAVEAVLTEHGVPYTPARTWTTDAFYRETTDRIARRREEGCAVVEMEAAAIAAVARFRGVPLAHVLYGGDDVSSADWDHRSWQSQHEVRDNLLDLAARAALRLAGDEAED